MAYSNCSVVILDKESQAAVKTVSVKSNTITFGAHPMNSFRVYTDAAERLHCKIAIAPKTKGATIKNFSKQNPVLVNGVPLARKIALQNSDVFEVAGSLFQWNCDPAKHAGEARKNAKRNERKSALLRRVRSTDDFSSAKRASVCNDVPRSVKLFLEVIRKRRTIHSSAFNVGEILQNGLVNDEEVLTEADITHEEIYETEMGLNIPPRPVPDQLNTPDVDRENMATPVTLDHTPKSKLSINISKVFVVSYSPITPAKELRSPLKTQNCSFATPVKCNYSVNVSMPEHNMHLIDLTTPTEKPDIARKTPKPKPRILSSFNLVTPSPKKVSQTPTLTKHAPSSATKTLLKSALKNSSSVSRGSASKAVVTPQRKKKSSITSVTARGTPVKLAVQQFGQVGSNNSSNLPCMPNLVNQSHDGNLPLEVIKKRRTIHSAAAVDETVNNGVANDDETQGENMVTEGTVQQTAGRKMALSASKILSFNYKPARSAKKDSTTKRLKSKISPTAISGKLNKSTNISVPDQHLIDLMTPTEPKSHILSSLNKHSPKKDPQTPTFSKNAPPSAAKTSFISALRNSSSICKGSVSKPVVKPQSTKFATIKSISARAIVVSKRPGEEDFTVQQMNEVVSDDSSNLPFITGIVTQEDPTPEVPYLITHATAVFNIDEVIKTPNRTTQVRSARYSDVTPHESFVEGGSGQTECTMNLLENERTSTPVQRTAVLAVLPSSPASEGVTNGLEKSLKTPCGIASEAVVLETVEQEELLKPATDMLEELQHPTDSDQINDKTSLLENELTSTPVQSTAVLAVLPSSPASEAFPNGLDESLKTPCGIASEDVVPETVEQEELLKPATDMLEELQHPTDSDQINDKTSLFENELTSTPVQSTAVLAVLPSSPTSEGFPNGLEELLKTPCGIAREAVISESVEQEELLKPATDMLEELQHPTDSDQINDKTSLLETELTFTPVQSIVIPAVLPSSPASEAFPNGLDESLKTPCGIATEDVVPETVVQEELELKPATDMLEELQHPTDSDQINDKTSLLENELTFTPVQSTAVLAVLPSSPASEAFPNGLDESLKTPCGIASEDVVPETVVQEELLKPATDMLEELQHPTDSDQINDKTSLLENELTFTPVQSIVIPAVLPSSPASEAFPNGLEESLETPCGIASGDVVPETVVQEELELKPATDMLEELQHPTNSGQNSENRALLTSPKPSDVVPNNEEDTAEFKTPVAPAPKRRLYSKKAFDTKTPENKTPSPFEKISSQDYLNILDNLMDESPVENGQNDDSDADASYSTRHQQQEVGRRVMPSRASRSKIKTLCVDELAGASPEMKICKAKFLPEMSPLPQDTDDTSLQASDRRRVLFQKEVCVKEINSPNIVGDIIKKVTGRGRSRRVLDAPAVFEEVKLAEISQDDAYPTDDDQNVQPKRATGKPKTKQVKAVDSFEPAVIPIKETKGRRAAYKKNDLGPTPSEVEHIITAESESAQPMVQQEESSKELRKTKANKVKEMDSDKPPTTPIKEAKGRRGAKQKNAPDLTLDSSSVPEAVEITEASQSAQPAEEQGASSKRPRKVRAKQVEAIESVEPPTTPIKEAKGRRGAKQKNAPDLALDSSSVPEAVEITETSQGAQPAEEQEEGSKRPRKRTKQIEGIIESVEPATTSIKETKGRKGAKRKNALDCVMDASTVPEVGKIAEASQSAQPAEEQGASSKRPRKVRAKQVEGIESVEPATTPMKETKGGRRGAKQKNAPDLALDSSSVLEAVGNTEASQPAEKKEESSIRTRKVRTKQVEEIESVESAKTPIKETNGRRGAKQKNALDLSLETCVVSEAVKATEPAEEVSSKRPRVVRAKQVVANDSATLVTTPIKETRARRALRKNVQVVGTDLDESVIPPTPEPKATQVKEVKGTVLDESAVRISPEKTTETTKRRNQVETTAAEEKPMFQESTGDSLQIKRKRGRPVGSGKAKAAK